MTYHTVPNPQGAPDLRFLRFPQEDEPDDHFRTCFKLLVQYWGPTPEQTERLWVELTTTTALDALRQVYDFGLNRHNPELYMQIAEPPYSHPTWGGFS